MADKKIGQLTEATTVNNNDLLVLEQSNTAKKVKGSTIVSQLNTWGEYDASASYVVGNKVTWQGASYVCKVDCQGVAPSDTSKWMVFASSGAKIVSTILVGQDAQGGNIYEQTFDNGATARFTAPKGDVGGVSSVNTRTGAVTGLEEASNKVTSLDNSDAHYPSSKAVKDVTDSLSTDIADVKGYIGYTASDIYGVEVDFTNRIFTRLAGAVGKSPGADFNGVQAFGGRKRCIVADNGTVLAYYGGTGYTEGGKLTRAITKDGTTYAIGTVCQVMVEQPKFYYKVVPLKLEKNTAGKGFHMRKGRYYVSDTMKEGFKLHPAFITNGVVSDYIYLSAYEGSTYDVSASNYNTTDAQTVDWANDKLASIANAKPTSGLSQSGATRAGFRTIAAKRGTGWTQASIQSISATMLLFLVEYAYLNTQNKLGAGVTNKTDDGSTNMAELTGATTNLGNASGSVTNENGYNVPSYRGEENWYGNIWRWIDGINLKNEDGSVKIADHSFADNSEASPYVDAGITYPATSGYIKAFGYNEEFDWLFITSEVGGDSSLPVGDYFYQDRQNNGWRVATLGGGWDYGAFAGGFYWYLNLSSSHSYRDLGGRLLFVPQ